MSSLINHDELISRAEKLVKEHMVKYDPSHDWAHVERVRRTALRIAKTLDGVDLVVIELAALFHDLADDDQSFTKLNSLAKYTTESSIPLLTLLQPFFESPEIISQLSTDQIQLISKIIPSVSWSTEKKLRSNNTCTDWHERCLELHVVQDADRLEAIGSIGILRVAAFSGSRGRLLVGRGDDTSEEHFYDKLLRIRERMKVSEAGSDNPA